MRYSKERKQGVDGKTEASPPWVRRRAGWILKGRARSGAKCIAWPRLPPSPVPQPRREEREAAIGAASGTAG
jgi:hypothetical protein